jgi:hypothetical protein
VRPAAAGSAFALLAGLLPMVAAHAAYLLNVHEGAGLAAEFVCMPYLDGCVSISRAARSGSGLTLFRALMLPSALLLFLVELRADWLAHLQACSGRLDHRRAGHGGRFRV